MADSFLRRIASKGYGWYLTMKIGKALLAVPIFPAYVVFWTGAAALLGLWIAVKGVMWDFPKLMTATMAEYWGKPWFRNFSRSDYNRFYFKPTVYRVDDAIASAGADGEGA